MNKKVSALSIAFLMILGTLLVAVPVNAVINPLPVFNATSGAAGLTLTVTAPGAALGATTYPGGHDIFVLFDKEIADADLGAPLFTFGADDRYVPLGGFPAGVYAPGMPIYADLPAPDPGATAVSPGDTRLTPVTVQAGAWGPSTTYLAGTVVQPTDLDIPAFAAAVPLPLMTTTTDATWHTAVGCSALPCPAGLGTAFNWARGDGIYVRTIANAGAAGYALVGPGDLRARYPSVTVRLYPSVTVTLTGTALPSVTYAAWTKVKSPNLDFQKPIYNHPGAVGVTLTVSPVGAVLGYPGDTRLRNVVIPQVRYAAGSIVLAGAQDQVAVLALTPFPIGAPFDALADTNNNGLWDSGEATYRTPLADHVKNGDVRNSYVGGYVPGSTVYCVAPNLDTDCNRPILPFPAVQKFAGPVAAYQYGDWIYQDLDTSGTVTPADVRSSVVDWTDKGGAFTRLVSRMLPAAWATDWPDVVAYTAGVGVVQLGDSDVGRPLSTFAPTDHHTTAGAYASGDAVYRDNDDDNLRSVGDTREVLISRVAAAFAARVWGGPWPWLERTAAGVYQAFWHMPGTNIQAGDADALHDALVPFTATEYYYDEFGDGSYLGSDLVGHGGTSGVTGNAQPFPVTVAPGATSPLPISFTVPTITPAGNHVMMVMDDGPPNKAGAGPITNAGFGNPAGLTVVGATLPFESLPWFDNAVALAFWDIADFGVGANAGHAGPAFFVIPKVCAVQMSPGTYAHTLGTPASIVKLDYTKGSIIQNVTGDISLNITLCGKASSISVYIPPEFTFLQPDTTSVWTSITNDYKRVSMVKLSSTDSIGPLWWNLRITDSTIPAGSHVVRMFNLRAPDVCGRYFVKVFVDGESIGSENFPTIVVKGNVDPAYVSGHVLNGDPAKYGEPISASGKVIAEGMTALGRSVKAQAYFKASANGSYTLYGLAAGTYSLTASAAGFFPATLNATVTAYPGQSLEGIDIHVYPSTRISGTICSKCGQGSIPWGIYNSSLGHITLPLPITVEILDSNLESKATLANKTGYDPSQAYFQFSFDGSIDIDGHVPQDTAGYVSGLEPGDYYLKAYASGYLQTDIVAVHVYEYSRNVSVPFDLWRSSRFNVTVHFMDSEGTHNITSKSGRLTLRAYSLDGTLWGSNSTIVPKGALSWNMMIAGTVNYGLPSGTYMIEADFPGYSQGALSRATLGEGCSTTSLSFDMVRGGNLELTLRSVNWQTPPQSAAWRYPDATIRIEAMGSSGEVYTGTAKQQNAMVDGTTLVGVAFANITGLPTDTYLVRVYTVGYIQTMNYPVSASSVGTSDMTVYLVEATRLDVTLEFRKEDLVAPIDTYTRYNLMSVPARIEVYDSLGVLVGANTTYIPHEGSTSPVEVVGFRSYAGNPCLRWINYYDTTDGSMQKDYGLPPGTYQLLVWVPGYAQARTAIISTTVGSSAGIIISLDRMAHVNGTISGLDMYEDLIPLSWATVTAYGPILTATTSLDGVYEMWIVNGTYTLGVSSLGYEAQGMEIRASMAWEIPVDFDLRPPSGTVPELSATGLTMAAVLVIACASLRKGPPAR